MNVQPQATRPLLIAGGGLGGLAAALALGNLGFRCRVLERRDVFDEAGAGIQIGPNGVKALRALGVAGALADIVGVPAALTVRDGSDGRLLTTLPLGRHIEARLGAPYWTVHRADLHAALAQACARHSNVMVTMGFAVDRILATVEGVTVISPEGTQASGAALIGADGVWSTARGYVTDRKAGKFAGRRAYRAVIETAQFRGLITDNAVGLWLSRGCHVVHYPVRAGSQTAVVVVLSEKMPVEGWSLPVDRDVLMQRLRHLSPDLVSLLGHASEWRSWDLYEYPPVVGWANGRTTLLGDAAHPVLPFLAQGGVLALEDALTLAHEVAADPNDIVHAFQVYAEARMGRAQRVARVSKANGAIYHMSGVARMARNLVLRVFPGHRLLERYDWLYSWNPP